MVPGWRFGWIAIHDPKNYIKSNLINIICFNNQIGNYFISLITLCYLDIRLGFNDLTTRILGPNSLVQGALPEILANTPQSYFDTQMQILSVIIFNYYVTYSCLN